MPDKRPSEGATQLTRRVRTLAPAANSPRAFLDRLVGLQLLDSADAETFAAERLPGLHDRSDRGVISLGANTRRRS